MSYVMVAAAAVGIGKSILVDRPKEERQRKLAAETQRYSPWTGLQAGQIQEADPLGSAIAFGATGAQLKAGRDQQEINKKLAARAMEDPNVKINYNYNPHGGFNTVGGASGMYYPGMFGNNMGG